MNAEAFDNYLAEKRLVGQIEAEWREVLFGDCLEPAGHSRASMTFSQSTIGPIWRKRNCRAYPGQGNGTGTCFWAIMLSIKESPKRRLEADA